LSWYDWRLRDQNNELLNFVKELIAFRKAQPVLQRRKFFNGSRQFGNRYEDADIVWFNASGAVMKDDEWLNPSHKSLGIVMNGSVGNEMDDEGNLLEGDSILFIINAHYEPIPFKMPQFLGKQVWQLKFDTAELQQKQVDWQVGESYLSQPISMSVFSLSNNS
jgi:isoamylase